MKENLIQEISNAMTDVLSIDWYTQPLNHLSSPEKDS